MKINVNSPFGDEKRQIGVDFDGVIHKCSKGFHDGTVYDDPIEGSLEAIKTLSEKYVIVVYSAKARKDRPLVQNKTGVEHIWGWLEKHGFAQYVQEVTSEKPRALFYIDDRAITFTDWDSCLEKVKNLEIITNG
jgi:hypothetical protein